MISKDIDRYCSNYQDIENYEEAVNDETQMWECHHRLETETSDGLIRPLDAQLGHKELKALDMYLHRPAEELIFLTRNEHRKLHGKNIQSRKKISDSKKGAKHPFYKKWSPHRKQEAREHFKENYLYSPLGRRKIAKLMARDGFPVSDVSISNWRKEYTNKMGE